MIPKKNEKLIVLFISYRLARLIAKKCNKGEWSITYLKLDEIHIGSGFKIVAVSLNRVSLSFKD